jgi:hypothetical protein
MPARYSEGPFANEYSQSCLEVLGSISITGRQQMSRVLFFGPEGHREHSERKEVPRLLHGYFKYHGWPS